MATVHLDLDEELVALLGNQEEPPAVVARELIVMELYRRGTVSSGWAAERLGMERYDFIRHASGLGIPFFNMTEEEWQTELRTVDELVQEIRSSPTLAP